jgi:hypothetical protein
MTCAAIASSRAEAHQHNDRFHQPFNRSAGCAPIPPYRILQNVIGHDENTHACNPMSQRDSCSGRRGGESC